jgi:uroporphyrinogen decarboxylase
MKRIIGAYKDLGFLVIKHTDGYIMPLLDMYLDVGFDCLDPIDPTANMDLKYMKDTYGDKISLKGNVDCSTTLYSGTVDETIAETRHCLEVAMGKTGYICSSSNSIHSSVNPACYKAMIDTIEEFGRYEQ